MGTAKELKIELKLLGDIFHKNMTVSLIRIFGELLIKNMKDSPWIYKEKYRLREIRKIERKIEINQGTNSYLVTVLGNCKSTKSKTRLVWLCPNLQTTSECVYHSREKRGAIDESEYLDKKEAIEYQIRDEHRTVIRDCVVVKIKKTETIDCLESK